MLASGVKIVVPTVDVNVCAQVVVSGTRSPAPQAREAALAGTAPMKRLETPAVASAAIAADVRRVGKDTGSPT
jgi:hypothetical protein